MRVVVICLTVNCFTSTSKHQCNILCGSSRVALWCRERVSWRSLARLQRKYYPTFFLVFVIRLFSCISNRNMHIFESSDFDETRKYSGLLLRYCFFVGSFALLRAPFER